MRVYLNFKEAESEIKRDLVEMGIRIHPKTYQDKWVADDPDFETMEIQNYIYTVVEPRLEDVSCHREYCLAEWRDREAGINGKPTNPGNSYLTRYELWKQFLDEDGKFAYTYPERYAMHDQVRKVIRRLKEDPDSRQCYITVWQPEDICNIGGISRVPCSLGYQLQYRKGQLNMTYLQRSCDFANHMGNDVYLSVALLEYIADETNMKVGNFTHWLGSLHLFKKDGEGVF